MCIFVCVVYISVSVCIFFRYQFGEIIYSEYSEYIVRNCGERCIGVHFLT